ncbi:DUF6788 family protein [Alicyclobacillus mali (ex Roth et al. 2021)]|uniref:DUF6788 family protein n=1 Tax=Alicyclobacillus mali (ex Roth et al. 2021) TaxID=1123961 RepID=UPI001A8F43A5|nr:DUF6788 family protein [Alicyclobacillus mali (ex Roth et al. 2021)]
MAIRYDGWSIAAQYRKCGKPACRVCREGPGHGPYWYGSKTVDGRRISKYFGKTPPVAQEITQDEPSVLEELSRLREENASLRAQVAQLQAELAALRTSVYPYSPRPLEETEEASEDESTIPEQPRRRASVRSGDELTRADVEAIWREETEGLDEAPEVLAEAHDALLRNLFPVPTQDTTRLKTGTNPRKPYVCPFRATKRGGRLTFGSADKLVRTAIPWLIQSVKHQREWRELSRRRQQDRIAELLSTYRRMDTLELVHLVERMERSMLMGDRTGWTVRLEELDEHVEVIRQVIQERND